MADESAITNDPVRLQRSSRDYSALAFRVADWLAAQAPIEAAPEIVVEGGVDASGLSSETLILTATWPKDEGSLTEKLVARIAPNPQDVPVFWSYRLDHQFALMRLIGAMSDVPVPNMRWLEDTGAVLGSPFFLMDYIEGVVPPDVLPYTFGDNWLFDASIDEQRIVQDSTVQVLAKLHSIEDPGRHFAFLHEDEFVSDAPTALRRHFEWVRRWYSFGAADVGQVPLLERTFAWLVDNWPTEVDNSESVLLWGDSRIGNVIYRDFEPVAVLDWEMATLGPRELDVAWLIFSHMLFQELAEMAGLSGMPTFLQADRVTAKYAELSGIELGDLRWFYVYSALMFGCAFLRAGARRVHFGEQEDPQNPESFLHHHDLIRRLIDEKL